MYRTDHVVFLELHKTGSSHVRRMLTALEPTGQGVKHERIGADDEIGSRLVATTMRDPWDWYVSLWAYGVGGAGSLVRRVTNRAIRVGHGVRHPAETISGSAAAALTLPTRRWRAAYADDRPETFRRWLRLLLDHERAADIGEGFAGSGIPGLLTFRYLWLVLDDVQPLVARPVVAERRTPDGVATAADVAALLTDHGLVHRVLRAERLVDDVLELLREAGRPASQTEADRLRAMPATNVSTRAAELAAYYDAPTAALVGRAEAYIVRTFGYTPPRPYPGVS